MRYIFASRFMIWLFVLFPLIGSLLAIRFHRTQFDLTLLLLFSGAYLLTVTLAGILPEALRYSHYMWIFVGVGYVLQLVVDIFSKGAEHGHIHSTKNLRIAPLFLALFLHAIIEGMPLALLGDRNHVLLNYFIGLALHEIPAGFVLGYILLSQKNRAPITFTLMGLYALAVPVGYTLASMVRLSSWNSERLEHIILAFCSGILLHIATTVITENFRQHSFNKKNWGAFALGLLVAVISLFSHQVFN